jgi:putative sigma-54 modulation protein
MQMTVQFSDKSASRWVRENLATIVRSSIVKFQDRVQNVSLVIEDINGPKGGVDKECRCIVRLKRMKPIVIRDRDANVGSLVRRVAERASYALGQKIQETRTKSRRGRTARNGELPD